MSSACRSLCIVARDPLQCSELVLSLQATLDPDDEVEIILDRRRERSIFEATNVEPGRGFAERRRNTQVDLEVRTKGFAIVPATLRSGTFRSPRPIAAPDADDRARFENVLSFRRRREARPRRVVGAASAVVVALVLAPPLSSVSHRASTEIAPSSGGAATSSASGASIAPLPGHGSALDNASRPHANQPAAAGSAGREPKSGRGALETYIGRVENATGRIVSKANGLIDRVKSEVVGNAPMSASSKPPGHDAPDAAKPRPTQTP